MAMANAVPLPQSRCRPYTTRRRSQVTGLLIPQKNYPKKTCMGPTRDIAPPGDYDGESWPCCRQHVRTQIFELRFSNHANALALQTIIKRIGIGLQTFSVREQFAAAFAR
jgi:hypothetical protein